MHERDLIREARAALDDLVDLAPKAPSLESITAGYAPLRRVEPPLTRWRPIVILAAAAAVTLLVVGIASWIGSNVGDSDVVAGPGITTSTSEVPIEGVWVLTSYTYEGATLTIDETALATQGQIPAWIEITGDEITGYTGCNGIRPAPRPVLDGNRLVFGEIIVQAVACTDETPEPALLDALWSGSDGVELALTDTTMTWSTDTVVLTFMRREQRPTAVPGAWDSSIGRLDCSPGAYLTRMIPLAGQPPDDLLNTLMAVPGVTTVWEDDPFWWGLDGGIIAGGTYVDTDPRMIQIVACATTFGGRADADLAGATFTWANNLGLAQTSPLVWSERFIELCSADDPDLDVLAGRYIEEDAATSVRSDGSTPPLDQAAQTLEIIQQSTCAAERSPTTTAAPPGAQDGVTTTTTIIPSGGPASCSTTGMEIPADYPPAYEGLPDPVARTWGMLYDAALGCDFEGIINIALEGADSEFSDMIFWGATGTLEGLVRYDADYGSLRSLVLALTTLPAAPFEGQRFDAETQSTVPQDYWSWPPVHDNIGDGVSITDLWDTDTLERVAALNDMTVPELVASIDEFGAYAGFRVGIAEDGSWLFALAGD